MTPERDDGGHLGILAWHELVDRDHDLQNPTSAEKIRLAGLYLRLGPEKSVLDVACGKAGPALILAHEFGCRIHGVDVSAVFIEAARRRITDAGLANLISVEVADAAQVSAWPSHDVAVCLGAAFVWGHIGDAAQALAQVVGAGGAVAVGEPFWRKSGRADDGFVDLPQTVARFEAPGIDLIGIVAASEDDWDRYRSLQWRAAVEIGDKAVIERHMSERASYLSGERAELGWGIFIGRVR
jgi:SAM-dependent methyltransferase